MIRKTQVPMREQDPRARIHNFDEVPLGYTPEEAMEEAKRCLQCKNAPCVGGCPVGIDIPGFIAHIAKGDFRAAIRLIKESNNLPAICGRVCPQETQCQGVCTLGRKFEPVAIGRLERFVADWERENGVELPRVGRPTGFRVAVVGSGPAGLTCAVDLRRYGHEVTMFEALHEPGGVLMYGIPEFRLPKAIVKAEISSVREMGAEIVTDAVVGKTFTIDDLFADGYHAVFVGSGAGLPRFLGVPGESLIGVYSANEFLTRVNLMRAYRFPEYDTPIKVGRRVAVVGGGNVAMDAARTALRLGAEEVLVLYRRTEAEMPARREEIHHAVEEGVRFEFLVSPVRFLGENGRLSGVECVRMELGAPDESGRRRPVPIEGSEFSLAIDTAVIAIGNRPHPLVPRTTPGLEVSRHGTIVATEDGATSRKGVFAGGDIVTGAATVISAMGAGKRAAAAIHHYLLDSTPPARP
ncbi:MAG: Glutamate synthase (NADPH), homotetrameric [Acetothermia bacterium 64_32]|nr:MAG: Glutamate synthase (NADPH), homotetrameric [Acetothermia bacterium 64_32]